MLILGIITFLILMILQYLFGLNPHGQEEVATGFIFSEEIIIGDFGFKMREILDFLLNNQMVSGVM